MKPTNAFVIAVLVVGVGGGAAYWLTRPGVPVAVPEPAIRVASPAPSPAPAPMPQAPPPVETLALPSLDASDPLAREKGVGLTANATWKTWLKREDLIRRAAAAIDSMAAGDDPVESLPFLVPRRKFTVVKGDDAMYADPRNYARFDSLASVFSSIDADKAVSVYRELKPLLQQACAELGDSRCDIDARLGKAVSKLLAVPRLKNEPELRDKGAVYAYADERLEALSEAQKALLRMGPRNVAKIQEQLGKLSRALKRP